MFNRAPSSSFLREILEDPKYETPDEVVIQQFLRDEANRALVTLPEREAAIIQHRFGLNGQDPVPLRWLGDRLRLTKERVRQLEVRALKQLKYQTDSKYLAAYVT